METYNICVGSLTWYSFFSRFGSWVIVPVCVHPILYPLVATPGLRVQFGGEAQVANEGDLLRLQCNATNAAGNEVTVIFRPHPLAAVQVGNELYFRNVTREDAGRYTCIARSADGRREAFVDLSVGKLKWIIQKLSPSAFL